MPRRVLIAIGVLGLAACAQDPLARHSVYWGLSPFDPPTGPLVPVLDTSPDTPAKQGLLYTAMRDAEIAATYTDRAISRRDEPGETAQALGEVIYAIEPAAAPDWATLDPHPGPGRDALDRTFTPGREVPGWGSQGYGLQRALGGMTEVIEPVAERDAALREGGGQALGCLANTADRASQVLALSEQALAAGGRPSEATVGQIREVAIALNRGVPAPGTGGCGLEDVYRQLDQAVVGAGTG